MTIIAYPTGDEETIRNCGANPSNIISQAKIHQGGADLRSDPSHPIPQGLDFSGRISTVQDARDRIRVIRFLGATIPGGGEDLNHTRRHGSDPIYPITRGYEFSGWDRFIPYMTLLIGSE